MQGLTRYQPPVCYPEQELGDGGLEEDEQRFHSYSYEMTLFPFVHLNDSPLALEERPSHEVQCKSSIRRHFFTLTYALMLVNMYLNTNLHQLPNPTTGITSPCRCVSISSSGESIQEME